MKGRPPKDTGKHIEDGTYNVTRHAPRLVLPTVDKDPPPPTGFDKEHIEAWKWICERCRASGNLTAADPVAMEVFCKALITSRREYTAIQKEGSIVESARGPVKNPRWNVYDAAVMVLRQMFDQFGLTPLARMRLKTSDKPNEPDDPLDFLNN